VSAAKAALHRVTAHRVDRHVSREHRPPRLERYHPHQCQRVRARSGHRARVRRVTSVELDGDGARDGVATRRVESEPWVRIEREVGDLCARFGILGMCVCGFDRVWRVRDAHAGCDGEF